MWYPYFFITLFLISLTYIVTKFKRVKHKKLPPSPPSLPIIGHFHLLKEPLHRALQNLSQKYGPILSLSFGSRPVINITSPAAVQECFTKNDIVFANRPRFLFGKHFAYNYTTVGFAPYGDHWRNLRRLTTTELLSTHRLNVLGSNREEEFKLWLKNLFEITRKDFVQVEMKSKLNELSFNTIMTMISRKRNRGFQEEDFEEAREFKEIIKAIFHQNAGSNLGDYLPILGFFDFQGIEKRMLKVRDRADAFLKKVIDRHREKEASSCQKEDRKTMIENLLSLQESDPDYYTDDIIKGHILTIIGGGTDTTTGTIEWAMSLLLNHPSIMKKAWIEINECIGHDRLVNEGDLSKLHYLQAIINETLRLFPAAPLLVRESSEDCTIGEFYVEKGTMLLVNIWAVHRDPLVWKDPASFKPERFEEMEIEGNSKLIPFGMGRRACPGAGLANRVIGLTLAALIQCFEWERIGNEKIDLTEGIGTTIPKAKSLEAMCKVRTSMIHILSQF